jgi:choline/glycine/proline betaine transport protein
MTQGSDVYTRLEVFTQTGSAGYDIVGLTRQQVIDDVLDRYEAHLAFLQYSTEHDYDSVVTPPLILPATGSMTPVEPPADGAGSAPDRTDEE